MIHVLYNCYQEASNLPRSIKSVREVMGPDLTFTFVDGRYPDYPEGEDFSTDGTEQIAREAGYYLPISDHECEKRTAGLAFIDSIANDGDWVLVMDADETLTERFSWPTENVGQFNFKRMSDGREYGRNRLYRWQPGLEFKHRHYDLYDSAGNLFATLEAPPCEMVGAGIHYDIRSPQRQALEDVYYDILRNREGHPSEAVRA